MNKWTSANIYLLFISLLISISFSSFLYAKNLGVIGEIYSIQEEDFLEFIQSRAASLENNGALSTLKQNMQHQAEIYRDRPKAVEGILHTVNPKSWLFDPSIVLDHDIVTPEGKIVGEKGQRINPLNYISLKKSLIFYDSDDKKEIDWVIQLDKKINGNDKLILTNGSLLQEEKRFSKPVYFDQAGKLTNRFGITHVPAVVTQEGNMLRIREVSP